MAAARSDPEWKYVAVTRTFIKLEHSIDRGTQWAASEPSDEPVQTNVDRHTSEVAHEQATAREAIPSASAAPVTRTRDSLRRGC
jgi:phage tail sheath protein FI